VLYRSEERAFYPRIRVQSPKNPLRDTMDRGVRERGCC